MGWTVAESFGWATDATPGITAIMYLAGLLAAVNGVHPGPRRDSNRLGLVAAFDLEPNLPKRPIDAGGRT